MAEPEHDDAETSPDAGPLGEDIEESPDPPADTAKEAGAGGTDEVSPEHETSAGETTGAAGREEGGVADPPLTVALVGVGEAARSRIEALDTVTVVEDTEAADCAILSTRVSRARLADNHASASQAGTDVVGLAHTGGEAAAAELMRGGALTVVAEGNEDSLPEAVRGRAFSNLLIETYERRVGNRHGTAKTTDRDETTGLPGRKSFDERLANLEQAGELPRLALLRVLHLETPSRSPTASETTAAVRRRLAVGYRELARAVSAEVYALGGTDFAILARSLAADRAEDLLVRLSHVTETFAPGNGRPLALAAGHAGPEVAIDGGTLSELAGRALTLAADGPSGGTVSAESLSLGVASTTELETALRMIDLVERTDPYRPGHGQRVAKTAGELAREMGMEPAERGAVQLAAHFHAIGKVGLSETAVHGDGEGSDTADEGAAHAQRGADILRPSAGDAVADAIRDHHERWDGSGAPTGAQGPQIPLGARIIAVADRFDALTNPLEGEALGADVAAAQLRAEAGGAWDPTVCDALNTLHGAAVSAAA